MALDQWEDDGGSPCPHGKAEAIRTAWGTIPVDGADYYKPYWGPIEFEPPGQDGRTRGSRAESCPDRIPALWTWKPGHRGEQRTDVMTGLIFLWSEEQGRWVPIDDQVIDREVDPVETTPAVADANFETGAVRSADVDHLDFASLPLLGLLGVMRVAACGGTKYGRFNYHKGMPVHATVNHAVVHVIRWLLGDRSEPHLLKASWGLMVADQTATLQPELCAPHVLGPGAAISRELEEELQRGKPERDARRARGEFEALFNWTLTDTPEVAAVLEQRKGAA